MTDCPPSKILLKHQHRRNLPGPASRRRAEGNFVLAFERAYLAGPSSLGDFARVREVPVTGFGVADLVWLAWQGEGGSGGAIEGRGVTPPNTPSIRAFEMKLQDWAKGLAQAVRYRFFAHESFLVVPMEQARLALKKRETFESAGVGLISFEPLTGRYRILIRAEKGTPLSARAHRCIVERLSGVKPFKASQAETR